MYIVHFLALVAASAELNLLSWGNTAFNPPYAATQTFIPNVNLTGFVSDYSSARVYGTISTVGAELVSFNLLTDGGVLMWIDDHLTSAKS